MEYTELARLHHDLHSQGFSVVAFPTNQFHQELETNDAIAQFWHDQYPQATFPIMARSALSHNPVYQRLQQQLPNDHVQHNFFKYLVNQEGIAVRLFTKRQDPLSLKGPILELLHAD